MRAWRRPRRRWWGWLVAIAYLLASMTPSLAMVAPLGLADLSMQCDHDHEFAPAVGHQHVHDHAGAGSATHLHDVAIAGDCDDDQHQPSGRHANCCGSVLCFSAVYPQALSIAQSVALRSRCEARPDVIRDEAAFRRHYRPPIA